MPTSYASIASWLVERIRRHGTDGWQPGALGRPGYDDRTVHTLVQSLVQHLDRIGLEVPDAGPMPAADAILAIPDWEHISCINPPQNHAWRRVVSEAELYIYERPMGEWLAEFTMRRTHGWAADTAFIFNVCAHAAELGMAAPARGPSTELVPIMVEVMNWHASERRRYIRDRDWSRIFDDAMGIIHRRQDGWQL